MTQRPRVCLRCQGRIGWEKRRDALYCSSSCKQAAYHERAGLPIERWRVLIGSVGWASGLDDLPSDDWGAQVFVVAYSRTTQYKLCDYPIENDEAPYEHIAIPLHHLPRLVRTSLRPMSGPVPSARPSAAIRRLSRSSPAPRRCR
ncbi:hypothetical protein JOD48_002004 [Oerskovia paurometabola]|nr:hypothetical protein [Oerskovia paurometabola]